MLEVHVLNTRMRANTSVFDLQMEETKLEGLESPPWKTVGPGGQVLPLSASSSITAPAPALGENHLPPSTALGLPGPRGAGTFPSPPCPHST